MASDIDNEVGGKPYAVIFGATSLVGRHLLRRLAERGFGGLCLSRRAEPAPCETPPGFSWGTVSEEDGLRVHASATLFSLVPIPPLPPLLARTTGRNRLIPLSTSSAVYNARSPDPAERRLDPATGRETGPRSLLQPACQPVGGDNAVAQQIPPGLLF